MWIERFEGVSEFYAVAAPYLERNEAAHTLQLGLRSRLERDPYVFAPDDPRLYAVFHGSEVAGVVTQTPPFPVALSLFGSDEDGRSVAERFAADGHDPKSVSGPVGVARAFAERWSELAGCAARVSLEERIYEASAVISPRPVPGFARLYEERDRATVVEWIDAFMTEVMPDRPEGNGESFLERRSTDTTASLLIWDDGGPVSLAGCGAPSPNGMRVGPVYTPPALRGRGYASAVTAAVTQRVLDSGRRLCFLYTDLANPTSNSIYQRIGYRPVTDATIWQFEAV